MALQFQLQSKAASKAAPTSASAFTTLQGSIRDPQQDAALPVDSTLVWDNLADKLARRSFVVLKIPIKGEWKGLGELKDNFREILAKQYTPTPTPAEHDLPPSVFELLADKKRKLLEDEQAQFLSLIHI